MDALCVACTIKRFKVTVKGWYIRTHFLVIDLFQRDGGVGALRKPNIFQNLLRSSNNPPDNLNACVMDNSPGIIFREVPNSSLCPFVRESIANGQMPDTRPSSADANRFVCCLEKKIFFLFCVVEWQLFLWIKEKRTNCLDVDFFGKRKCVFFLLFGYMCVVVGGQSKACLFQ